MHIYYVITVTCSDPGAALITFFTQQVSRAIGDREYKAEYGEGSLDSWRSTAPFYYPTTHSGLFNGDLIISTPDINHFQVAGDDNVLLLACDGLWDVLDADDAVRLTRKLVFERGLSARESVSFEVLHIYHVCEFFVFVDSLDFFLYHRLKDLLSWLVI